MNPSTANMPRPRGGLQRGMSLIYALLALVALSLAAVALVRSVDSGVLVIGNLGFKQDATLTAEQASEQAINWLWANRAGVTLHNDGAAGSGYFASSLDALDATGVSTNAGRAVVDWAGDGCASYAAGSYGVCLPASGELTVNEGNRARYVIARLCSSAGSPSSTSVDCAAPLPLTGSLGANRSEVSYSAGRLTATISAQYYRVVVRTRGPRNTVGFTETIVHF